MSNKNRGRAAAEAILTRRQPARLTPLVNVPPEPTREFPDHPCVGVGGIVVHDGQVLLVRRGREPLKGRWSIPGGLVNVGEGLRQAVQREINEETGLAVEPLEIMGIFERIQRDPKPARGARGRRVRYHYVIVDYVCRLGGSRARDSKPPRLQPASDVVEAEWVEGEMLSLYDLSEQAEGVIIKAMEFLDPDW